MKTHVCDTCNDTHRMSLGDRTVMCTRCPTPCEKCRAGPYCTSTPCYCDCHKAASVSGYKPGVKRPPVVIYFNEEVTSTSLQKIKKLQEALQYLETTYADAKPLIGDGGRERCFKQAVEDVIKLASSTA
jgi:hypothetical protein